MTFPRLQDCETQETWPNCPAEFYTWLQGKFHFKCSIKYSVVVFQCLLVSLLEGSSEAFNVATANTTGLYLGITKRTDQLLKQYKEQQDLEKFTTASVTTLQASISPQTIFCLFLDDVGTLVNNYNFPCLSFLKKRSFFEDPTWNLYRSLRHAARNLLIVLRSIIIPTADRLMLIVTGTNCNLANFCHSDTRMGTNRPATIKPHELSVPRGLTLPPVFISPPYLNPLHFVKHCRLLEPLSSLLSHGLALSLRPLWIAYFTSHPDDYMIRVNAKVTSALTYSSSKVPTATSSNSTVLSALLLTCCLSSTVPYHVLSTLVECSFASVTRNPKSCSSGEEVFLSVPMVDPLVATCCWNVIMDKVRGRPYEFFSSLKELLSVLIFSGVSSSSISLISESIAACVLLYLFALARGSTACSVTDFLHPVSLFDVMNCIGRN
ncbi:hypothetical protein GEMRC1_010876 [Eukaryota sp. GEM-RC1]